MEKQPGPAAIRLRELFYQVMVGLIASIWLINGLFCKVFSMVPRHQEIIGSVLGHRHEGLFTVLIGCGETLVALWVVSTIRPRAATIFQVLVILVMNILEFILVPGLLLWGRLNLLFAVLLVLIILYTEFVLRPQESSPES